MKRVAAVALVLMFAVGCAGRGTRTGSTLTREADTTEQRETADRDFSQRPIGQR